MTIRTSLLLVCTLSATALAQPVADAPAADAPQPIESAPVTSPAPATSPVDATPIVPPEGTVPATPTPPPPPTPAPPPPPTAPPTPVAPPAPTTPTATATKPAPPSEPEDDYYSRERALGIFHQAHVTVGGLSGTAPAFIEGMPPATPGATTDTTMLSVALEGAYLGIPSSFGNFHGIEVSTGIRTAPFDYWLSFGTAVTLLNLGHGGPGSVRIGGSFGAGVNFAHGYGYIRGRAAIVLVPRTLDAEIATTWTPPDASTSNFDERTARITVWYRASSSTQRAFEAYVESFQRTDATMERERAFTGVGGGVGVTLF